MLLLFFYSKVIVRLTEIALRLRHGRKFLGQSILLVDVNESKLVFDRHLALAVHS